MRFDFIAAAIVGLAMAGVALAASASDPHDQTFGPRPIHADTWIEKGDYPPAARVDRKGGITRFALSIDDKGLPYRCAIVQSSGMDALDNKACELMLRRGHFVPARDRDGSPLPSRWANSINWRMFGTDQQEGPVADVDLQVKSLPGGVKRTVFTVAQTVRADGTTERCEEFAPSRIAEIDTQACKLAEALAMQGPLTDLQDKPVRGIRVARVALVADPDAGSAK